MQREVIGLGIKQLENSYSRQYNFRKLLSEFEGAGRVMYQDHSVGQKREDHSEDGGGGCNS